MIVSLECLGYIIVCTTKIGINVFPNLRIVLVWILNIIIAITIPFLTATSRDSYYILATNMLMFLLLGLTFVFIFNFQLIWYEVI